MSTPQSYILDAALSLLLVAVVAFVVAGLSVALSVLVAGAVLLANLAFGAWIMGRAVTVGASGARTMVAIKQLATVPLAVALLALLGPVPLLFAVLAVVAGLTLRLGVSALHQGVARSLTLQES